MIKKRQPLSFSLNGSALHFLLLLKQFHELGEPLFNLYQERNDVRLSIGYRSQIYLRCS